MSELHFIPAEPFEVKRYNLSEDRVENLWADGYWLRIADDHPACGVEGIGLEDGKWLLISTHIVSGK